MKGSFLLLPAVMARWKTSLLTPKADGLNNRLLTVLSIYPVNLLRIFASRQTLPTEESPSTASPLSTSAKWENGGRPQDLTIYPERSQRASSAVSEKDVRVFARGFYKQWAKANSSQELPWYEALRAEGRRMVMPSYLNKFLRFAVCAIDDLLLGEGGFKQGSEEYNRLYDIFFEELRVGANKGRVYEFHRPEKGVIVDGELIRAFGGSESFLGLPIIKSKMDSYKPETIRLIKSKIKKYGILTESFVVLNPKVLLSEENIKIESTIYHEKVHIAIESLPMELRNRLESIFEPVRYEFVKLFADILGMEQDIFSEFVSYVLTYEKYKNLPRALERKEIEKGEELSALLDKAPGLKNELMKLIPEAKAALSSSGIIDTPRVIIPGSIKRNKGRASSSSKNPDVTLEGIQSIIEGLRPYQAKLLYFKRKRDETSPTPEQEKEIERTAKFFTENFGEATDGHMGTATEKVMQDADWNKAPKEMMREIYRQIGKIEIAGPGEDDAAVLLRRLSEPVISKKEIEEMKIEDESRIREDLLNRLETAAQLISISGLKNEFEESLPQEVKDEFEEIV